MHMNRRRRPQRPETDGGSRGSTDARELCKDVSQDSERELVLVLDIGGGYVRAGFSQDEAPRVIEPNAAAVVEGHPSRGTSSLVFGADIFELPTYAMHRPVERGLSLDVNLQCAILQAILRRPVFALFDFSKCSAIVTESPWTPASVRCEMVEMLFDTFSFRKIAVAPAALVAPHGAGIAARLDTSNPCYTILDAGYSGSIAYPCVEGQPIHHAGCRSGVGGRVLVGLLAERLKLLHFDLSRNWLLVEDILCKVSKISHDFEEDLLSRYQGVEPVTYVLPDFAATCRGSIEDGDAKDIDAVPVGAATVAKKHAVRQRAKMRAERVVIPEAIFRPQDHGLIAAGAAELVYQSIFRVKEEGLRSYLCQILVCGGLALFPGFCARLQKELRAMLPSDWPVLVVAEDEPELSAWRGAASLACNEDFCGFRLQSKKEWYKTCKIVVPYSKATAAVPKLKAGKSRASVSAASQAKRSKR